MGDGDDASPETGPGLLLDDFVRTRLGHLTTITAVLHPHLVSLKARPRTHARTRACARSHKH